MLVSDSGDVRTVAEKSALSKMLAAVADRTPDVTASSSAGEGGFSSPTNAAMRREQQGGSAPSHTSRLWPSSPPKLSFPKKDNLTERCKLLSPPGKRKLGVLADEGRSDPEQAPPNKIRYEDIRSRKLPDVSAMVNLAEHHHNAGKLLQALRDDAKGLEELMGVVTNFRQEATTEKIQQLRRKQATLESWKESFEEFFEKKKKELLDVARSLADTQQKEVVASREELLQARGEVERLEKFLAEKQQKWQAEKERNFAESSGLREREQRLRRQIDALASNSATGKAQHEENVRRLGDVIADLEGRNALQQQALAEQTSVYAKKEREMQDRIAMLENDPSLRGRGVAAQRELLDSTAQRLREALESASESVVRQAETQNPGTTSGAPSSTVAGADAGSSWAQIDKLERELALLGVQRERDGTTDKALPEAVLNLLQELGGRATGRTKALLAEAQSLFSQIWLLDGRNRDFVNALVRLSLKYPFHCPSGEVFVASEPVGQQTPTLTQDDDNSPLGFLKSSMQQRFMASDNGDLLPDPINMLSPANAMRDMEAGWTTFSKS